MARSHSSQCQVRPAFLSVCLSRPNPNRTDKLNSLPGPTSLRGCSARRLAFAALTCHCQYDRVCEHAGKRPSTPEYAEERGPSMAHETPPAGFAAHEDARGEGEPQPSPDMLLPGD